MRVVQARFGQWSAALRAAGFEPGFRAYPDGLRERAELLGDTTLSYTEIAKHLRVPVSTVRSWLVDAA